MSFLNKRIFSLDPKIFGLDLSDLSVKVLQFEKNGAVEKIRAYCSLDIPPGNIEDSKILRKDKVASCIKKAIKKAGPKKITTRKVICSLPESKAFIRIISIPAMEREQAREAIKWEMEANIPLPIDQVYFDWQFLPTDSSRKQSVLTVAVSREVVDEIMEVLEKAGLEVYGLEVESIASARSLVRKEETNEKGASLIIDLGAQRTSFIMIVKGVVYFTSSIPFSSEGMNDAIMRSLRVSLQEAEEIKLHDGITRGENNENEIFHVVAPLLENLVTEVKKTLDFYGEISQEQSSIEKIILCGGGANLKGLVPYLSKRLGKEVEVGNPWVNVALGDTLPVISKEDSVRYSTVIGLALKGSQYGN